MRPNGLRTWAVLAMAAFAGAVNGSDYSLWSLALPESKRAFWEDADGDGVRNGMEYVAGTDPLAPADASGPPLRFGLTKEHGEPQPRLDLVLPSGPCPDVVLRLEVSGDMQTWVPVANRFGGGVWVTQQGTLAAAAASGTVQWTGDSFVPDGEGLFYRFSTELIQTADGDADGLADQWELQYGLNPLSPDANQDPDGDGLTNLDEQQAGTHPFENDTDRDGMYDGCQAALGVSRPASSRLPQPATGLLVLTP